MLIRLSPCYSIVFDYSGVQRYSHFLSVDQLDQALIFLSLAVYRPSTSVSMVFMLLYIF